MPDAPSWTLQRDSEGIATLTLDRPGASTNVLSRPVLEALGALLDQLAASPPRALVVRSGKASGFIAGADINEFVKLEGLDEAYALIRGGQQIIDRLAALPCPTVAAIHGFALGGGLELALACRYRVAADDDKLSLGLPEVQLGIHPGFGGTVRTVRLLGARPALELMLTGKPVRGAKALRMGLVDRLVPRAELDAAAKALALHPPAPRRAPLGARALSWPLVRPFIKPALVRQVAARARRDHYPAPYAIIDLWAKHGARGAAAFEAEARSIARLFLTDTSRNLVRVFFLQDRLKALGGRTPQPLRHVHVIGAGVMGGDIAAWCALRGFDVTLQDRESRFIEPALARARDYYQKRLKDEAKVAATLARLRADVAGDGVPQADVVVEAIYEKLDAKRELFASLEPRMKPGALLATNTSSIKLEQLAEPLADPGRLVGLHFFNPVAQMPLVEIVSSDVTHPEVANLALAFARRIDKLPLPCRSAPGFVVNRVLTPYLQEAMLALEEGVPAALIDKAAVDFGMPMGPIELADIVGLDVSEHVGMIIAQELGRTPPPLPTLERHLAAKEFGRKSGRGFYEWRDGKAVKPDPGAATAPADLTDRMLLALVNECVAVLREGTVDDADLLDAGVIFGTGFAPFRGGPLAYARKRGHGEIVNRLQAFAAQYGARFTPDAHWRGLDRAGKA
ncbi:MAG TPA: 3-hydroxyacyl-CoA dehydrogenase NAD-binding domain-containing protein [Steroidobacteraceae bacterium]|nr:3-hydroxyacyl-CoA dehydrogenase NAD-binding domain-containing protein [Steroidobacteraceae bacterium]HNS27866.1 3-hydroxyacyl-CoA dehydrogenase NAD-binding domain-containing protein [Steroidobacteraceae bacterium]